MAFLDRFRARRRTAPNPGSDTHLASAHTTWDDIGATVMFPDDLWNAIQTGSAPTREVERELVLQMLEERGQARQDGQNYHIDVTTLGRLDDDVADLLDLPPRYDGEFVTRSQGNTTTKRFEFTVEAKQGPHAEPYRRTGAIISLGHREHARHRRLTTPLIDALRAVEDHEQIPVARRSDQVNVQLVAQLHRAQRAAAAFTTVFADALAAPELGEASETIADRGTPFPLDLHHFENLTTHIPDRVRVTVDHEDDGSLLLTPDFGSGDRPEDLNARWGQLKSVPAGQGGVLRVKDRLILLDEGQVESTRRIHKHQRIPADRAKDFLHAPADFLGPAIDGDVFSIRVRAIGALQPVSFHDAASTAGHWFSQADDVLPPEDLVDLIDSEDQLVEYEDTIERTWERGGSVVPHGEDHLVDVSDREKVTAALTECRRRLAPGGLPIPTKPDDAVSVGFLIDEASRSAALDEVRRSEAAAEARIDLSGLKFSPYPHQQEGIEWLVSRMRRSLTSPFDDLGRVQGAILADDMGLGKTFMTLVALRQFVQDMRSHNDEPDRPHLLVLPLTLLENWSQEMAKSFTRRPFDDVLTLHCPELNRFRLQGMRRETEVSSSSLGSDGVLSTEDVRLSLAVGESFGSDRLDVPGRIVMTTYETLASYQLSLGSVRWGAVVFDEAQDIKNAEALRTRAAKGLRARFKLVATGTPVENSLKDLWCLMDTAQPGALGSWLEFKKTWVLPLRGADSQEKRRLGLRLAEETRPLMLRRNKEDHLQDLPSKTIYAGTQVKGAEFSARLRVSMPEKQASKYSQVLSSHHARSSSKGAALTTLGKLRSISLHPDAMEKKWGGEAASWRDGARLVALMQVLNDIQARGEKAIVFIMNKAVQRRLALWIGQNYGRRVHVINGDTQATGSSAGASSRSGLIRDFEHVDGFNVIIMSPVAAGRGLTVTGANHAIHLERHWNPAKEAQATDRVYRIGQQKPVHVYLPMAIHPDEKVTSFDENLNRLMADKTLLKDAVVVPEAVDDREVMTSMGIS